MAKLYVPPPEGKDDRSDINLAILTAVGLIGLSFYAFTNQKPDDGTTGDDAATEVGSKVADDPLQRELKSQRARSEQLGELGKSELSAMDWTEEDQTVVFRFGPRSGSEVVCENLSDQIKSGQLGKQMRMELEKTLDRRTEFAPWTCMTRLYLARELPEGALLAEMEEWWAELQSHAGNERLPVSVLKDFRESRERPENPMFWSWARMCAIDFDYQASMECQRLLYQISPAQGSDLITMVEKHWEEAGINAEEMPLIITGLGHLARNGQPYNWKVKETDELPDYEVDLRQAAVGYLCRFVNTPTPEEREGLQSKFDDVPALAAEQLRKVAVVGARAYEQKLLIRWRESCRLAFGGRGGYHEGVERIPVPLLAVWDGDLASAPDYRLSGAIERGVCETKESYPPWFCLADSWTDEERTLDRALAHSFIETRYMEWDEAFEPEDKPELLNDEAPPADEERVTGDRRQGTGDEEPPSAEVAPPAAEANNQEPPTNNQEPTTNNQEPK